MKIAIASIEDDATAEIALQAGRAPFYLIFENDESVETIKNPFSVGGGGAGLGVAKMLADKGINKVIAGKFGDKMIVALQERGVDFEEKEGKIQDFM